MKTKKATVTMSVEQYDYFKNIEEQIGLLEDELDEVKPNRLKQQATELAQELFRNAMRGAFRSLGLEDITPTLGKTFENLEKHLGEKWYDSDRLDFKLGIKFTNRVKEAYSEFGIKPEVLEQK